MLKASLLLMSAVAICAQSVSDKTLFDTTVDHFTNSVVDDLSTAAGNVTQYYCTGPNALAYCSQATNKCKKTEVPQNSCRKSMGGHSLTAQCTGGGAQVVFTIFATTANCTGPNSTITQLTDLCQQGGGGAYFVKLECPASKLSSGNSSCLTPQQQKDLKTAVTSIKAVLITATTALRIAALAEKNATIKKDLWEAATVTSAVNQQLVSQLEKIANESCGTCDQIVTAVNDAITAIESTLAKIDPDWKNNAIFKAVVAAIQSVIDLVKAICPSQPQ